MKHSESDVEQQISIQSIHLGAFRIIYGKEKETLKITRLCSCTVALVWGATIEGFHCTDKQ